MHSEVSLIGQHTVTCGNKPAKLKLNEHNHETLSNIETMCFLFFLLLCFGR